MNNLVEQHLILCNQLNAIYEQKNKELRKQKREVDVQL